MLKEERLSYAIRGCVYAVFKQLGGGFLEKVYENALLKELQIQGLHAESQVPIKVRYKDAVVGKYIANFVEDSVILELKAQQQFSKGSEAHLLNYLKATDSSIGMLVNFAYPRATVRRMVI